ncbi:MAG: hypothetical protein K2H21_09365 [Muribaculaceae bacterium]|nr:hypothetical protein [Muribaculaceae bacterium]
MSCRGLWFVLPLVLMLLGGCVKNEFRMEFALPDSVTATYRISYFASDPRGGLQVESAVAVSAGKGEAVGLTRYPTLVTVSHGTSPIPAAIFYAERGDKIILSGSGADPVEWNISGNKPTELLTRWRLDHRKVIETARRASLQDSAAAPARRALNKAVADFVKEHSDSPAARLLLFAYFDAGLEPREFDSLWRSLPEENDPEGFASLLARQDLSGISPALQPTSMKGVEDLVVQSADNNIDTLRFASSGHPLLLYYWQRGDDDRNDLTDSLRRLTRWRRDSAEMIIADISLNPDSSQWRGSIRHDSLYHTVRAFSPRGLADRDAVRFGVTGTPWFVVGDGKGTLLYAGPDAVRAFASFRSLRPKKDKPDTGKADAKDKADGSKSTSKDKADTGKTGSKKADGGKYD